MAGKASNHQQVGSWQFAGFEALCPSPYALRQQPDLIS
jgi:hypothetical protein